MRCCQFPGMCWLPSPKQPARTKFASFLSRSIHCRKQFSCLKTSSPLNVQYYRAHVTRHEMSNVKHFMNTSILSTATGYLLNLIRLTPLTKSNLNRLSWLLNEWPQDDAVEQISGSKWPVRKRTFIKKYKICSN